MTELSGERRGDTPTDPTEHDVQALIELLEVVNPTLRKQIKASLVKVTQYKAIHTEASRDFEAAQIPYDQQLKEMTEHFPQPAWEPLVSRRSEIDSDVLATYHEADERQESTLVAFTESRGALIEKLLATEDMSEYGRAAFIHALYYAEPERRVEQATEIKNEFGRLNTELVEHEILYHRTADRIGFSRVVEPGLKVEIKITNGKPLVLAKTQEITGRSVNINGQEAHVKEDHLQTNLTVFSSEGSWVKLLVGEDVTQGFATELAPAQKLCLAVIARQQGVSLENLSLAERCKLNAEQLEALREDVCDEIVSAMVSEKVTNDMVPRHSVVRSETADNNNPLPFRLNLRPDDIEMMRILAELCGLERDVITNAVHTHIGELENLLIDSLSIDPRTVIARSEVGLRRLSRHVLDKREIGIVPDLQQ